MKKRKEMTQLSVIGCLKVSMEWGFFSFSFNNMSSLSYFGSPGWVWLMESSLRQTAKVSRMHCYTCTPMSVCSYVEPCLGAVVRT